MVSGQIEENTGEEGEQEAVFIDAVQRLRAETLKQQIEDLNAKARQKARYRQPSGSPWLTGAQKGLNA